jgi:LmbE family N-acetylglucosaminyl deacetylase
MWIVRRLNANLVYSGCERLLSRKAPPGVGGPTVVFAAHPDDETLACGGVIAMKRAEQVPVTIVFLTDGGKQADLRPDGSGDPEYQALRNHEARRALKVLDVPEPDVEFLDYPDGQLETLEKTRRGELIATLARILADRQPVEIYMPHPRDGHEDHDATHSLVREALASTHLTPIVREYSIHLPWRSPIAAYRLFFGNRRAVRVPIQNVLEQKQRALAEYPSQTTSFQPGFLNRFVLPYEIFYEARAAVSTPVNQSE